MEIGLSNLFQRRKAESRSLSAENFRAQKGQGGMATPETTLHKGAANSARELGQGWKLSPCLEIPAGETVVVMDQAGPGVIRHIWTTLEPRFYRDVIVRIYWDGEDTPSVECPVGDFFCNSWGKRQNILAIPINVNPSGGMNCYFPMPFRSHAKISIQNDSPNKLEAFFYTINYTLETVPADSLYFHAQWRRANPLLYGADHVILDGVRGEGQYVGAFMAWQQNNAGWWGEGEIKMFVDGDDEFPTICGTGTEDYFGGAWGFGAESYSAPFLGFQQVVGKSEIPGARMTLYRFHVQDPVFFHADLRVTMQAIGWRSEGRYLPLQDDIASVAYWYQSEPHGQFPTLLARNGREVI